MVSIALPEEVGTIIDRLEKHGHEAYAVGGCVRDVLLGRIPKDWDITTDALPEQIKSIFPVTIDTGIAHGTVTVRIHKQSFEVTTYRSDGKYTDSRHPDSVTFVRDLREDLRRRDFTVNALAYNPSVGIVDEFGGREDMAAGIIRCVDDPMERFTEDALRMMRAVRFVAQLGFSLEERTEAAATGLSRNISAVSAERICDELIKLICTDNPGAMRLLYKVGLTGVFFPEWDAMMETPQNTRHHRASVGEHTICVMEGVPPEKRLRLAALLHDIAKPVCRKTDDKGSDHFVGHPRVGANMATGFMHRLKLDNATIRAVQTLILFHDERPRPEKRIVRRAMNRMGEEVFPDIFTLRRADVMGQSDYKRDEKLAIIDGFEKLYREILEDRECTSQKDLAITGRDIMELGVPSGPEIGNVLGRLLSMVIEDPGLNDRQSLLGLAEKIINEDFH